jgi:hypothetical protein
MTISEEEEHVVKKKKKKKLSPTKKMSSLTGIEKVPLDDQTADDESTRTGGSKKKKASKSPSSSSVSSVKSKRSVSSVKSKRSLLGSPITKMKSVSGTIKKKSPSTTTTTTQKKSPSGTVQKILPQMPMDNSPPEIRNKLPRRGVRRSVSDGPSARRSCPEGGDAGGGREMPKARGLQRNSSMPTHMKPTGSPRGGRRIDLESISEHDQPISELKPRQGNMRPASAMDLGGGIRKSSGNLEGVAIQRVASTSTATDSLDGIRSSSLQPQSMPRLDSDNGIRSSSHKPQITSRLDQKSGAGPGPNKRAVSMMKLSSHNNGSPDADPPPLSRNARAPPSRSRSDTLQEMRSTTHRAVLPPRSKSGNLDGMRRSQSSKPQSILRTSTSSQDGERPRRDPSAQVVHLPAVGFGDDEDSIEEASINFDSKPARSTRSGLSTKKSGMDISFNTWHTTQSMLTVDKQQEFEDDTKFQTFLRYIRILPPHLDENPTKRRIRKFTWLTLLFDFIAAMVSITTYDGVTTCCGVPIFSLAADINWNLAIRITTYVYLIMIFAEILPVLRKGLPFNLLNPMLGFTITFAMFFDDRIPEALCMWIIEAVAIFLEFLVYRLQSKLFHERAARLEKCDKDLEPYLNSKSKRAVSNIDNFSDDASMSGSSFGEEDAEEPIFNSSSESGLNYSSASGMCHSSSTSTFTGNYKLRKSRLLRERRILRSAQKTERVELRYHFAGVLINFGLICVSLSLISGIAASGGLCIKNMQRPIVFEKNQLEKCSACKGSSGVCEICNKEDGTSQCYYSYY